MTLSLFNPNLTAEGYSADNMLQLTREMGSNIALVRNSPKVISMMKSVGIKTIYREAGDDPIGQPLAQNPYEFAAKRIAHAPDADYYHMTNEEGFSPKLDTFNLQAASVLTANHETGIFYNASTNQHPDLWRASKSAIMQLHDMKQEIGIHIYLDGEHDEGALEPYRLLLSWGIQPFVTEFSWIKTIFDGEVGPRILSDEEYIRWLSQIVSRYPELKKAPLFNFSADIWPEDEDGHREGFGFYDKPSVIRTLALLNTIYKVEETMTAIPSRESLGEPIEGYIDSVPSLYVNIRQEPDPASMDIGDLHKNDRVIYRPKVFPNKSFSWYALEEPIVGWFANIAKVKSDSPQIPRISQDIPYISQSDSQANKFRNDCGIASLLMAIRFWMTQQGLGVATLPTVDDLSIHTPLAYKDYYLTFQDMIILANSLGYNLQVVQGMNLDKIAEYLRNGVAPIILVSYSVFNPGHGDFTHFCVPRAYNDQVFWVNDPYLGGENYQITHSNLDHALADVTRLFNQKYQGLVITN